MDIDDKDAFAPEPLRRSRRLLPVAAMVVPILLFVGASAWFIRSYVMPPVFKIPEPLTVAALDMATPLLPFDLQPRSTANALQRPPETIARPAEPPTPPTMLAALPPGPMSWPSTVTPAASVPSAGIVTNSEPIAGPIPLPSPRPRISTAQVRGPIPLPRPRPTH